MRQERIHEDRGMNTPNTPEILRDYILDAAHQRQLMEPWFNDQQFIEDGGKVAYAVDTDVITLFTNPAKQSIPQQHRSFGYATIFRDDDKLSIAIGQALAEHIFTKLAPGGGPLMVMPSLEAEIGRVFAAVARDARRSENAARDQVVKLREELGPFMDQPEELAEQLKTHAPELADILRGARGPNAVLNRFGRLFSEERIAGLDFLAERNEWYDTELRALFPAIAKIPDLYQLNRLTDDWRETLKKTKAPKKIEDRVEDDAQALARLQWMNEKIDSERFRIVFITGDEAISEAAAERPGGTESENFRDLYIRDPRAFMADNRVLFPWDDSKRRTHDLTEFLDLFLADVIDRSPRDKRLGAARHDGVLEESEDSLIDINTYRTALKRSPNMVTDFREKWKDFTRDVSARAISHDFTDRDLAIDADVAGDIEKMIDKVEQVPERRIDEAWSACFDTATRSGFILSSASKGNLASESKLRPRNAPPLYFDRFEETTKFVRALLFTTGKGNPQEYQNSLNMLKKEDEGTGYLFNLAFAMLFASMGRWPLTAILADRALQKVQESGDERFSGREAYYLKAITLRHTARKADDLKKIDGLIKKALACLKEDKKNHKGLKVLPIRFEIERTSAELALSLFAIFLQSGSHNNFRSLGEIQTTFQGYLKLSDDEKSRMDRWIYLNIKRKLLANIFMTTLLRVFKNEESVNPEAMTPLFNRFELNINDDSLQKIGISYLVRVVYSVSKIWLRRGTKTFARETIALLSDQAIVDASVMPYDKQRFKFLRDIVKRCLNEDRLRFREPR